MKFDVKKLDRYRAKADEFRLLEVPQTDCLMIDGRGDPNSAAEYKDALEALYPLAYRTKLLSRRSHDRDFVVGPLEGLWWADDYDSFTTRRNRDEWRWTMLIVLPDWITGDLVAEAREDTAKRNAPAALDRVRFDSLEEGLCVQTLHVGPYDDEGPVLERMHGEFFPQHGLRPVGRHHEIYLRDPRRTEPAKLRTILRQPVSRTGAGAPLL